MEPCNRLEYTVQDIFPLQTPKRDRLNHYDPWHYSMVWIIIVYYGMLMLSPSDRFRWHISLFQPIRNRQSIPANQKTGGRGGRGVSVSVVAMAVLILVVEILESALIGRCVFVWLLISSFFPDSMTPCLKSLHLTKYWLKYENHELLVHVLSFFSPTNAVIKFMYINQYKKNEVHFWKVGWLGQLSLSLALCQHDVV